MPPFGERVSLEELKDSVQDSVPRLKTIIS